MAPEEPRLLRLAPSAAVKEKRLAALLKGRGDESALLATAVAYITWRYGLRLSGRPEIRGALVVVFTLAFAAAAVAGVFGAFITKVAPIR